MPLSPLNKREPIRCFQGNAKPYQPFWNWRPKDEAQPNAEPELEFYGYISEYSWFGDDITPAKFKDDLWNFGKGGPITLRINSGGGEMVAASVIRSILNDYPGFVTTRIDGLCASAAVAVALAGNKILIQDSAYMMIHDPGYDMLMGWLDIQTLQDVIDNLKVFKAGLVDTYETRTGIAREKLDKMLRDTTWMNASMAVAMKFADELITGGKPAENNESVTQALQNYVNVPIALLLNSSSEVQPRVDDEIEREAQRLCDEIELYLPTKEN